MDNSSAQTLFPQPPGTPSTSGYQVPPPPPPLPSSSVPPPVTPPSPTSMVSIKGLLIKILIAVVVLLAAVFILLRLLASNQNTAQEEVKLVYWGLQEDKKVMDVLISDFEQQNPNIHVEYIKQSPKQYRDRLLTRIQSGDGPDIFRYHNTWVPMIAPVLLPLSDEVVSPAEFKKVYYPTIQTDIVRNGAILGVPLQIDTLSLFVNQEIFAAAGLSVPTNWDDFVKAARALTVKDEAGKIKTAGTAMGTYGNITHAPDIVSLLLLQSGADLRSVGKTKERTAEALTFYTSFSRRDGRVWDETLDPSLLAFSKGNLAMYFGYSWDIFTIQDYNRSLAFSVHPVPGLTGKKMTIASYYVEGVSSRSKHPREAMEFMKYLHKKETQEKFYNEVTKTRLFGELFARRDLKDTLKENTLITPFLDQAETAVSSPFAGDPNDNGLSANLSDVLGVVIADAQKGSVVSDKTLDTFDADVNKVWQQYGL